MYLKVVLNYLYRGLAVALAAYFIPQKTRSLQEIATIAVTVAMAFLVLDLFSPVTGQSAEKGAGMGIGLQMVGGSEDEDDGAYDDELSTLDSVDTSS